MNALQSKVQEVSQSLLPIVLLVVAISLLLVPVDTTVVLRFLLGALLFFLGLSIFLWGVDQSMQPIGRHMAQEVASSGGWLKAVVISFLLGFLITVAEPDLLILGNQVEQASGGTMNAAFLVAMISIGVGIMIALGALRILFSRRLNLFMGIVYGSILLLGLRVSEEFLAISFDASGATTGTLTTPFVLALSAGLSYLKGGKNSEADSFGMVGTMSAGPILAVMLLSILTGQTHIQGEAVPFVMEEGVFGPILAHLGPIFVESLTALAPIVVLFFAFHFVKFKLPARELVGIVRGLVYTLLGLTLFLVGANQGFMDMGRLLGTGLAEAHPSLLPAVGLVIGLIVVLAEPAVHVLGEQVEEVTAGNIPTKLLKLTLSIGVGAAIALSMVRIMIPEVKLWYFLLPGFLIAVVLSFVADPIFVGIAYDAGGVASGPMAATFVLSFAQGAADSIPTADVLADGFGVIAMIAMAPVLSVMILGTVFELRRRKAGSETLLPEEPVMQLRTMAAFDGPLYDLISCTVDRGKADEVVETARTIGAQGATILHGRDARARAWSSYSLNLDPEKEMLWLVVKAELTEPLCTTLWALREQPEFHTLALSVLPVDRAEGLTLLGTEEEEGERP